MLALQGVLVFLFPADVGFVNLDDAHEFAKVWIGEASANAMSRPTRRTDIRLPWRGGCIANGKACW